MGEKQQKESNYYILVNKITICITINNKRKK